MQTFNVAMYDLEPQPSNDHETSTGNRETVDQAVHSAMDIVTHYTKQGWIYFNYQSGNVHGFLLVKPNSALFKLVEISPA